MSHSTRWYVRTCTLYYRVTCVWQQIEQVSSYDVNEDAFYEPIYKLLYDYAEVFLVVGVGVKRWCVSPFYGVVLLGYCCN